MSPRVRPCRSAQRFDSRVVAADFIVSLHLVDSHCHLDTLEGAPEELIARAAAVGVRQMIAIGAGNGALSPGRVTTLASTFDEVYASIGIHPHEAGKGVELSELRPYFDHPKVVALGETGLDFFRDWGAPEEKQVAVFHESIALALEVKRPLIIHSRDGKDSSRASDMILEALKTQGARDVGGVFHCYPGDAAFAAKLRDINFLVSFPGVLTFKSAHATRETAKAIPLDQIMLETDAPYMAPEPFRGKPSEPAHVRKIAEQLALVKELPLEEIARQTTANARRLFKIS